MSQVYQRGGLRRVRRASGNDVWEWRYRVKGKMRQERYPVATYLTEKAMWRHLETAIKLLNAGAEKPVPGAATMGVLIQALPKGLSGRSGEEYAEHGWFDAESTYRTEVGRHSSLGSATVRMSANVVGSSLFA